MKWLRYITGLVLGVFVTVSAAVTMAYAVRGEPAWSNGLDALKTQRLEVTAICVAVLGVIALYLLASSQRKRKAQYLAYDLEGGGSVSISLDAMRDFVARISDEFAQVVRMTPSMKAVNGAVDVQLDVAVKAGSQIPELCRILQDRVREVIKQNVGVADVRDVRVRVQEIVAQPSAADTSGPESRAI